MKKILNVLLVLCLATGGGLAQVGPIKTVARTAKHVTRTQLRQNPKQVSSILRRRAWKSTRQASQLERNLSAKVNKKYHFLQRETIVPVYTQKMDVSYLKQLYPEMEGIITTDAQFSHYFTARNNREVLKITPQIYEQYQQIKRAVPILKSAFVPLSHPISEDMSWLSRQIPQDTEYLFLGEKHIPFIQKQIVSFIPQLRKQFPDREIIMFTEFLPAYLKYSNATIAILQETYSFLKLYAPIWENALKNDIYTIGLEFPDTHEMPGQAFTARPHLSWLPTPMFGPNLESIRLRNQKFLSILQEYRQIHPNALFVVHAGFGHVGYHKPYSISRALQEQQAKTFVVDFLPGYTKEQIAPYSKTILENTPWLRRYHFSPDEYFPVSGFDFVTKKNFLQRIVQFKNANGDNFSDITGFDVQIKVPALKILN